MSITVVCNCGHRFRVNDTAAGRRVRCENCTELVCVDHYDQRAPRSSSPRRRRRRKTRPSKQPAKFIRVAFIIAGCVLAVPCFIGMGGVVVKAVRDAKNDAARDAGFNPTVFGQGVDIVDSNAVWDPDPAELEALSYQHNIKGFEFDPPQEFEQELRAVSRIPQITHQMWYGPRNANGKRDFLTIVVNSAPEYSTSEAGIAKLLEIRMSQALLGCDVSNPPKYERGTLNGMQCLRGIAKAYDRQQNMQMMYIVYAVVLDGKVATTDLTLSVPLTDERLKALEAAARSIRPSTD